MIDNPSLFDGPDDEGADKDDRLKGLLVRVYEALRDGDEEHPPGWYWHLPDLAAAVGNSSTASVGARIRDLRKPHFGGFTITRYHLGQGEYEYRLALDSGDESLVYNPERDKHAETKADARQRIEAWLHEWDALHANNPLSPAVSALSGKVLWTEDIRTMLR